MGLDYGTTTIDTADKVTHTVDVGVTKTASLVPAPSIGSNGVLELVVVEELDQLTVGDNQLRMLVKYIEADDITQLRLQYDTNSATATTAASEVIALDFFGNVMAELTPAALTFI